MRKYTCHKYFDGYYVVLEENGISKPVSFVYRTLARLNLYWGVKNGIYFKSVKDVVYK